MVISINDHKKFRFTKDELLLLFAEAAEEEGFIGLNESEKLLEELRNTTD